MKSKIFLSVLVMVAGSFSMAASNEPSSEVPLEEVVIEMFEAASELGEELKIEANLNATTAINYAWLNWGQCLVVDNTYYVITTGTCPLNGVKQLCAKHGLTYQSHTSYTGLPYYPGNPYPRNLPGGVVYCN